MSIRIIAGTYRGCCIDAPASARPTLSRFRQALFDALESIHTNFFQDAVVLDCFAGSGALGIEAISRGAKFAYFVDKDREAFSVIKKNITKLRISDMCKVVHCDIINFRNQKSNCADVVFVDPPYGEVSIERTVRHLINSGWITENSYIITEEQTRQVESLSFLELVKEKTMGISLFRVFNRIKDEITDE